MNQADIAKLCHDTFSTNAGKELLDHLIDHFGILDRVFTAAGNGDPIKAALRDGERAAICYILKGIQRNHRSGPARIEVNLPK